MIVKRSTFGDAAFIVVLLVGWVFWISIVIRAFVEVYHVAVTNTAHWLSPAGFFVLSFLVGLAYMKVMFKLGT